MIISANVIKNPRKNRYCENCGELIDGEHVRIYGCAEKGDTPYVIYEDKYCAKKGNEKKIMAAIHAS